MYAKIFRSLFYGSLTAQADPQLVFVCLLTHADRDGHVELPPPVIATITGLSLERVTGAIAMLEAADPRSRTDEQDGRRLEPFGFARWSIVNYEKYRGMRDEHDRREQNRQAKQRERDKRRQPKSAKVSRRQPRSSQVEVEVEVEAEDSSLVADAKKNSAPSLADLEPLPLADGSTYRPTTAQAATWRRLFPAVDLELQFRRMAAWLDANKAKRKTARGAPRFAQNWLDGEQNPKTNTNGKPKPMTAAERNAEFEAQWNQDGTEKKP